LTNSGTSFHEFRIKNSSQFYYITTRLPHCQHHPEYPGPRFWLWWWF